MKQIIKSHTDVLTVPSELQRMKQNYEMQGYDCELLANCLKINFDDGYAMITWQDGAFWQECYKIIDDDNRLIIL